MSRVICAVLMATVVLGSAPLRARSGASMRVKDIASLVGVRPTPLIGYGLVIGLNRTGDKRQTLFTNVSLANTLERFGVVVTPEMMKVENIAAVMVSSELPPFARPGVRLDILVSSIGDARSLQGGTLVPTPLRGMDGQVVALAQGPLTLGGFGAGNAANGVQVNHLTAGRVPGGGLVQVQPRTTVPDGEQVMLALNTPDFSTASRLAAAVDGALGVGTAKALDPATVSIAVPAHFRGNIPELMARIEPLPVESDMPARVVINERTGTVVIGAQVTLGAAAVAHGSLAVRISTRFDVSQPNASWGPSRADTVVVPNQNVDVSERDARLIALDEGVTLDAVVRALNSLGVTPRDIIAIVQALKAAGSLRAEIVII
ncbi:Basal body P-ring protein [Luteitalea pratensis]|uniref:Flagellar P-ring protein n=2 Tax=Luteitalea pratensis TaxID=1855912 RepID=A0A143PP76_LUTPR|nr:flagellar basal body P-ring protein FlgI [Luteitalea pratensis]AMY10412.1 Basal body P-ring protein [Luteitalea pratensis]